MATIDNSSAALLHYPLLLVAVISALLVLLRNAMNRRTKEWPPGPPAWPLIGHLHLLGDLPHHSLHHLSQRYGPLIGLQLGRVPTIVASSPEMAKEILQTHDLAFAYRPRLAAAVHLFFDSSNVAFAPYGPYWKFLRQLYAIELFSSKRLDTFRQVREEEARALACRVLQEGRKGESRVDLRPMVATTSNNINCRMVMGKKMSEMCSAEEDEKVELVRLIEEVMHLCGVFCVGDYIPWLAWLDPNGYLKRIKATGKKMKALLQHVVDKRREAMQLNQHMHKPPQDLLDSLLAAAQNKDLNIHITDNSIIAAMVDVFIGGSDTSTVAVEWAVADLINNPRVMLKLQEELDKVVGKERLVEEGDISSLPYLQSIVKETMRLHPVAPLLIPREGSQDCQIGGYVIPSKTRVYVNAWSIQRDPLMWKQPLEYWPERFDDNNLDLRGNNFGLLPFGLGRRKCPGWALGFLNVHLMLATLIQGFTWSLLPPNSSNDGSHIPFLDMSERFGLTVAMAKPLHAFARPRLPLDIY